MPTKRGQLHYIVEVHGKDDDGKATLVILSHHAAERGAFGAVGRVLMQWEASCGAIPTGTTVKIKDARDGGYIWAMTYLGYESDTLLGR